MKIVGAIFLFAIAIGLGIGGFFLSQQNELPKYKTESECSKVKVGKDDCSNAPDSQMPVEGDCCGAWDKDFCLRGKVNKDLKCVAGGKILPLVLFITAAIMALLAIVALFLPKNKPEQKFNYDYDTVVE